MNINNITLELCNRFSYQYASQYINIVERNTILKYLKDNPEQDIDKMPEYISRDMLDLLNNFKIIKLGEIK